MGSYTRSAQCPPHRGVPTNEMIILSDTNNLSNSLGVQRLAAGHRQSRCTPESLIVRIRFSRKACWKYSYFFLRYNDRAQFRPFACTIIQAASARVRPSNGRKYESPRLLSSSHSCNRLSLNAPAIHLLYHGALGPTGTSS